MWSISTCRSEYARWRWSSEGEGGLLTGNKQRPMPIEPQIISKFDLVL